MHLFLLYLLVQNYDMYVANAKSDTEDGPLNAYDRQFVKLDMNALFNEKQPTN